MPKTRTDIEKKERINQAYKRAHMNKLNLTSIQISESEADIRPSDDHVASFCEHATYLPVFYSSNFW